MANVIKCLFITVTAVCSSNECTHMLNFGDVRSAIAALIAITISIFVIIVAMVESTIFFVADLASTFPAVCR